MKIGRRSHSKHSLDTATPWVMDGRTLRRTLLRERERETLTLVSRVHTRVKQTNLTKPDLAAREQNYVSLTAVGWDRWRKKGVSEPGCVRAVARREGGGVRVAVRGVGVRSGG